MGIATWHEVKPDRTGKGSPAEARGRSTLGRPGMRGGFKRKGR